MSIRDNGKGFDPLEKSSRNGLKNMQYRADQIEAIFEIESALGKGTTIKLQVKVS